MKKITTSLLVILAFMVNVNAQNVNLKTVIESENIRDFTVSIYKSSDYLDGVLLMRNNTNQKEFLYKIEADLGSLKSAENLIRFEDFNFDGQDEIVIPKGSLVQPDGIYIYDYFTGEPKKFFSGKFPFENVEENLVQNYIYTYRGSYQFNEEEKTITMHGSCGARCGITEIYRWIDKDDRYTSGNEKERYELVERNEMRW